VHPEGIRQLEVNIYGRRTARKKQTTEGQWPDEEQQKIEGKIDSYSTSDNWRLRDGWKTTWCRRISSSWKSPENIKTTYMSSCAPKGHKTTGGQHPREANRQPERNRQLKDSGQMENNRKLKGK
jgi:hypothetical protein